MALTVDELSALTNDHWLTDREAIDNFFTGNVLMYRLLRNAEKIGGGDRIKVPLIYTKLIGGSFNPTQTFDTAKKEIHTAAYFDWRYHYVNITIDIEDDVKNSGPEAEIKLFKSKMQNAQKTIKYNLATELYTGAATGDGDPLTDLDDLFNTTTSTTYGDIAEDDFSEWKANVTTTTENLSLAVMRTMRRTAKYGDEKGMIPQFYMTTDALKDAFEALLQPQQRFEDPNMAKAGFRNVMFGDAPVMSDMLCPSGVMYGLNDNGDNLKIVAHKNFFLKHTPWRQPVNSTQRAMQILFAGNLVSGQRRAHIKHTNLS